MPKLMTSETDALSGETIIREYTDEEIAQREADLDEMQKKIAKENAEKSALAAKKEAVLAKLGLSAEEVTALLA